MTCPPFPPIEREAEVERTLMRYVRRSAMEARHIARWKIGACCRRIDGSLRTPFCSNRKPTLQKCSVFCLPGDRSKVIVSGNAGMNMKESETLSKDIN